MMEATKLEMTEADLLKKLDVMDPDSDEQRNAMACAIIGHSRIQTTCFGYYYCARCGAQVGDALGSIYNGAEKAVIVGHKCEVCEKNYAECTWRDKLFCPDPFAEPQAGPLGL